MQVRHPHQKIPDIKCIRSLTRLLGKLGIKELRNCWQMPYWTGNGLSHMERLTYGWGLKETKDYVEAKYKYEFPEL